MKKTISSLLSVAVVLTTFASENKTEEAFVAKKQTYVLVHGAWQAPYAWDAVSADLIKKGNNVIIVELPGHGNDKTQTHTLNMDVYRDKVINALSNVDEKVILVGHSMAGMVISSVAEKVPAKIGKLVYIGAFLPKSGEALTDLAFSDPDSRLGAALVPSADQLTIDVKKENLIDLFISDGTQADKDKVLENYRTEPAIPLADKVTLTGKNFGSVEKVYIKTLQDVVVSPGLQNRMIADAGIKTIYEVDSSHSPFLSQPKEVVKLLLQIGK